MIITKSFVKKNLPKRSKHSSKIDGGKVLILGGGKGLYGAGVLAALAATRTGAGYTHLMTDLAEFPWIKYPDFIVHPFLLSKLKEHKDSAIGIGPGMGKTTAKKKFLSFLIKHNFSKVVVDGDALIILSQMTVKKLPASWILTPHEGELARLMKVTSSEVKKKRLVFAMAAQKKYGCIVILKGAETIVASSDKTCFVRSGTLALAKAGTGDVLLGMITALYAQGLNSLEAALIGCYLHGYASQLWLKEKKDYLSMRPGDLIDKIPEAIYHSRR